MWLHLKRIVGPAIRTCLLCIRRTVKKYLDSLFKYPLYSIQFFPPPIIFKTFLFGGINSVGLSKTEEARCCLRYLRRVSWLVDVMTKERVAFAAANYANCIFHLTKGILYFDFGMVFNPNQWFWPVAIQLYIKWIY